MLCIMNHAVLRQCKQTPLNTYLLQQGVVEEGQAHPLELGEQEGVGQGVGRLEEVELEAGMPRWWEGVGQEAGTQH